MKRTPLKRGKPIKRSNPARKKRKFLRNYGERAEQIRAMRCLAENEGGEYHNECFGDIQAAHVKARGMGGCGGDKRSLVPLCAGHHHQQGQVGILTFQQIYGLNLEELALDIAQRLDTEGYE